MNLRPRRGAAIAALALSLFSCARIQFGDRTLRAPRTTELSLRWQRRLVEPAALDWAPVVRGGVAFDHANDRVFVGSVDRGLRAIRSEDGALLWRFEALGRIDSTPIIADDATVFGAGDGAVYSVDSATGRLRWRSVVGAEVVHAPVRAGRLIVVVTGADAVVAMNASDGRRAWTYRRSPPGGISSTGHAGLLVDDNRLFTGFADGTVVCLDPTDGSLIWEQDTAAEFESADGQNEGHQAIDVDTTPVVVGDTVYVASQAVGLLALDKVGGARRWTNARLTGVSALGTDGRALFAASLEAGLVRIDPFDGRVVWARSIDAGAVVNMLSVSRGRMLVSSVDRGLWVVRAEDGVVLDGLRPGRGIAAPALLTPDSRIFVHSNADILYSLDLER
ncbi:MAG: PQQ-like beta-propeller repeat protein [Myxococcales bacterium]|nr:PQQ-like beta-propeller repeat protein [Myxococcales bacterium]